MTLGVFERLGREALFRFDPETAHGLSVAALKSGLPVALSPRYDTRLKVSVAGIDFLNPLGMAAGYDKNAEVPDALLRLGFGFVEVGTVTPLPQPGNPKPRIFRLTADDAVINRLGFNNEGHAAAETRLAARAWRAGVVGVNIGANKDSPDRMADYEAGVRRFAQYASYLTVNISSPNTPSLRDMQERATLGELLARVVAARDKTVAAGKRRVPVFLKIAPDLGEAQLDDIAAESLDKGIDGLIVSNTTLSRVGLSSAQASQAGGLSGRPLFERSTVVLAKMRKRVGSRLPIIGVGGVDSADTMLTKIRAGADLVQLYTGLVYGGPGLPGRILKGLSRHLDGTGATSLAGMRDSETEAWATRPLPAP